MSKKIQEKKEEQLKNDILKKEEKREYYSERFKKIEDRVKESLKLQKTDEALRDITLWALVLWSSDIHYEVFDTYIVVRFRIDWILVDIFYLEPREYKLILERLKYSSSLKLNITDIPQDWKYSMKLDNKDIDVRISTLPVWKSENVVTRILDNTNTVIDFEKLWFIWTTKRFLEKAISKKNWMILITWPTWSWKTTTLYTILSKLNTRDKKLITLEDPIEYKMDWVIQSEVDEAKWFTFQTWLKAILRQDPDIIMIGEIRDQETLRIAIQAALTGHLVFSTLHTNDAISALPRMVDMGIEPYLVSGALVCIEAQRLVRKLCPYCKQKVTLSQKALDEIKKFLPEDYQFYKSVGCQHCSQTGYLGREMISEILSISDHIASIVANNASKEELKKAAYDEGFIDMFHDGVIRAANGVTTIEEVYRVAKIWNFTK